MINIAKKSPLALASLAFLGINLLAVILSIAGLFHREILASYMFFALAAAVFILIRQRKRLEFDRPLSFVTAGSIFIILALSIFTTPTIFSGRDQGSYSEAAIRLSQNHQLEFSTPASEEFYKIYGKGRALNFPGFNYTKDGSLITQFPLGYISWLAIFYSLFGLNGFIIANAISFFVFLISFYLLSRLYLSKFASITSYGLLVTSFIFSWFFKFTLGENLALALVWFGILQFVLFLKKSERFYLFTALISFAILAFTRIEALAFLGIVFLILIIKFHSSKNLGQIFNKKMIFFLCAFACFYLINIYINHAYYVSLAKGFLGSFSPKSDSAGIGGNLFYNLKVFGLYGILVYLCLGIAGIALLLLRKKYDWLISFFVLSPSLVYLFNSSVSPDHPWMLRRFVFALVPGCILYSVIFLDKFFTRKIVFYAFSALLFISNLAIFVPFLNYSENRSLLPQIEKISSPFKNSDLVLVDREATGSGFSMMTGPLNFLYGKQAVYFFNPLDLEKIDRSKFSNIYFIIPDENLDFYSDSGILEKLTPVKDYEIETERLDILTGSKEELYSNPVELPAKTNEAIYGKIYILE